METLRILDLEDDELDAELVRESLVGGIPCEITRAQTRAAFFAALEGGGFDLILSDYSLPSFDGLKALELAKEMSPEVPFILISGAIGEERAIEALKSGATDYVLKQHLERLVPVIRRAMREAEERLRYRGAEEERELLLLQERATRAEAEARLEEEWDGPLPELVEALVQRNRAMARGCEIRLEVGEGFSCGAAVGGGRNSVAPRNPGGAHQRPPPLWGTDRLGFTAEGRGRS